MKKINIAGKGSKSVLDEKHVMGIFARRFLEILKLLLPDKTKLKVKSIKDTGKYASVTFSVKPVEGNVQEIIEKAYRDIKENAEYLLTKVCKEEKYDKEAVVVLMHPSGEIEIRAYMERI